MSSDSDELEEAFRSVIRKSKEECGEELLKLRRLSSEVLGCFTYVIPKDFKNSLVMVCLNETWKHSAHMEYLCFNGLYRNAFDDIRYTFESMFQAFYVDIRHRKTNIKTKIEILKEIEEKREYHASRLIDELEIEHKDMLKKEYKKLSRLVHPSHEHVVATLSEIEEFEETPVKIECAKISEIYDSLRMMYDIVFFLFVTRFPDVKESLKKNSDLISLVKLYNLTLLSKALV